MIYEGCKATARHIELLYGSHDYPVDIRLLSPNKVETYSGELNLSLWKRTRDWQLNAQYSIYIKPNLGGWKDDEITSFVACFVDGDDVEQPDILDWHRVPDFIVSRNPKRWQAWWVLDQPGTTKDADFWRMAQQRLAAKYGTDPTVCNPARLMRLAGTLNLKGETPEPYTLWEP